ncbi:apolipoprotein N-acyltransferase [Mycobacterium sp. 852002-51152_SCH6134967]|uniref:apolipoprotein N-acyltransferase n=1 Tax=Mycobacterium sp. 852002-51152_SCH6134967 TaxID=1834096 RepID=UPI0007FD05CE|nr:apolipoprotein N-acyltransferase [Mycobacterium sp. 852002-51152_SCH6134967]OBF89039.1 apolipoprotein N-acyltransferase [Mycobacterium sp. 852002-51152_SCH6134967]
MAETLSRARRFGQGLVDRLPQLGVAIVAGVLLCLSFPPFGWWYLGFLAFALLAWVLTRETTTVLGGFGYGFLFGAAFYLPLLPWVGAFVGPFPWIGLSLAEAVFPALFGAAAVVVRRLPGWPLWFAGLWAAQEWLKSTLPFGGFPWGVVAYGQTESPLRSIAQLGGAPLLSFAVVLVGFSFAAMVFEVIQWWRRDDAQTTPPAVVVPGLCISAVLLATALTWPHVRQSGLGAGDEHSVTVAVVQGNVPRLGLDFNAQRRAVLDNHVRETLRLAEDVRAGRAPQPMFVVWPENSSDIDPLANSDAHELISSAAAAIDAPILVGAVVEAPGATAEEPTTTNSVIVWNPESGPGERHDKQIVQPFGEYLPWRGFFRNFSEYADRAGYFVPGDGTGVVHPAGVPVGVATCWEVIFDRAPRESVRNGAQLLVVPSNNATFTESMSEQQLAFARLRAVEHDRYVVVAGTTGISAIVSPDGRELARTAFYEPAYLDSSVRLKTQLTAATRFGPLVEGLLIVLGVGSLIVAMLHNEGFVRRRVGGRTTDRGAT